MSGPLFSPGSSHDTSRLSVSPDVAVTIGASGLSGFSSSSPTVIVTSTVSVPPFSSSAFTATA